MKDRQYHSIDLVKFIMAIAVIAIHTNPLINYNNIGINYIYNNLVSMAVPFFFISSGYLLSKKLNFLYLEKDISILKKHMIKILKLYLIWMLIYTPLSIHHSVKVGWSFNKILSSYFQGLFYIGEQYNSWHLWYLLSTIYLLIIIIFFINKRINLKALIIMCLVFSIISIGIDWFVALRMNMKALLLAQKLISNTIYNGRIFKGMIYIPLGMYLAHRPLKPSMNLLLFSGAFISNFFIVGASIHSLLIIISSVGFFGLIENIHLKDNGIYPMLRNMSIIIYLIHMYVWSIYYKIIYNNKTFGLDSFLITTITSMALAYLYLKIKNIVKKKINVLNYWYK